MKEDFDLSYWRTAGLVMLLCTSAGLILDHFSINSARWNFMSGILITVAVDVFAFIAYRPGLKRIAQSNFFALVISSGLFSFIYASFNSEASVAGERFLSEMSFSGKFTGKFILDVIALAEKIPVINLGLIGIVICWIVLGLVKIPFVK